MKGITEDMLCYTSEGQVDFNALPDCIEITKIEEILDIVEQRINMNDDTFDDIRQEIKKLQGAQA